MNNLSWYTVASFLYTLLTFNLVILSCPYEFSREDQRPFFEQYEVPTEKKDTLTHNSSEPKEEIAHEKK